MKTLLHSVNLNQVKLINEEIESLSEELSLLINTSKYDLSPAWPLGNFIGHILLSSYSGDFPHLKLNCLF